MNRRPLWSALSAAGCTASVLAFAALPACAADRTISGMIAGYECGDNCYLTIVADSSEEQVGLCAAPECEPWNEVAEMPVDMVGRRITVTVGVGVQYDGSGTVMGEMQAFEKIEFE